jgi:hypothetical protein
MENLIEEVICHTMRDQSEFWTWQNESPVARSSRSARYSGVTTPKMKLPRKMKKSSE